MRQLIYLTLLLCISTLQAQTYEVGLFAGGANNIGDVGSTSYLAPSGLAYGAIAKWNKSKRYAWRIGVTRGNFVADDSKSNIPSRQERGFRVENKITEASLGLEFNFVEYNLHRLGKSFTPYLYTGLTYFRYDFNYFDDGEFINFQQTDGAIAIPMTVGFKYRLNQFFILGAEIGARYTFTDNLDASNPVKSEILSSQIDTSFGNIFSDDWYVFSGITLTYTFGRKPCQACFE